MIISTIRRSFDHIDKNNFILLYKALVRPHLEYANVVWCPFKQNNIDNIESVQRRATKLLPELKNKPYHVRLKELNLPTLQYRRLRGDMIEAYKIFHGIYDKKVSPKLPLSTSSTRGHKYKLSKEHVRLNVRKNYYRNRIVNSWNSLNDEIIDAPSIKAFEARLNKFWSDHPLKYYTSTANS